jgi:hypothetical protein
VLEQRFDPALQASPTSIEQERLADGSLRINIGTLAPNEQRPFRTQARCVERSNRACSRVVALVEGSESESPEACLEILGLVP